jgi:hypothetical protein
LRGPFLKSISPTDPGDGAGCRGDFDGRTPREKTRKPPLVNVSVVPRQGSGSAPTLRIVRGSHRGLPKRQRTDRTRHLRYEQVGELVNATRFAHWQGDPLIVHMTVIWAHFDGFTPETLAKLTTQFFDVMSKWLRRRRISLRAVWVRERGQQKGHHLHALVNVPIRLVHDLELYLIRRFAIADGGLDFSYGRFGMRTPDMQLGALQYICKTLDHRAFKYYGFDTINIADELGIQHRGTDGAIQMKRAGTTQNIGRKARRDAGWKDARSIEEVRSLLQPMASNCAAVA